MNPYNSAKELEKLTELMNIGMRVNFCTFEKCTSRAKIDTEEKTCIGQGDPRVNSIHLWFLRLESALSKISTARLSFYTHGG